MLVHAQSGKVRLLANLPDGIAQPTLQALKSLQADSGISEAAEKALRGLVAAAFHLTYAAPPEPVHSDPKAEPPLSEGQ